jgi:Di-haem oxidoreductase, putative peroxidase
MGPGLADGKSQGQAGPDEFRTAPLWGLGKRAFFLHDGRTSDLSATTQNQKWAMGIKGRPNIVLSGNTVSGQPNLNGNDGGSG